ncbi:hypothetical protein ACJRO7_009523 [Eucalyptus globulus]|uniref:RNA helicase n=1 Tax=Eucalyptus globulus TaxID=34317 RepID=A0ABD3L8Y6_EUCGL
MKVKPKLLEHQGDAKKEKKRKALELHEEDEEEKSKTSSKLVDPDNLKGKKKARLSDGDDEVAQEEKSNAMSNLRISDSLRLKLKDNGIEALFPIQAITFDIILDGIDLDFYCTLAFVLLILESLTNGPAKTSRKIGYSRPPSALVLLPRELAKQMFSDFEVYGGAMGLTSCCLYGGAPYHAQESQSRRGVDIVIGTPSRVKGNIDLSSFTFLVLDEADEMLRIGFVEDVELILGKVEDTSEVQMLLFSISSMFLKQNKRTIDPVGTEKMKASTNVRHIVIPCTSSARPQLIPDIIRCYSCTVIFTKTKESASQLLGLLPGARPLHGDIQQAQRELLGPEPPWPLSKILHHKINFEYIINYNLLAIIIPDLKSSNNFSNNLLSIVSHVFLLNTPQIAMNYLERRIKALNMKGLGTTIANNTFIVILQDKIEKGYRGSREFTAWTERMNTFSLRIETYYSKQFNRNRKKNTFKMG